MDACNITATELLQQIIGEVVQEPRMSSLEQKICDLLKKAEPQLLSGILESKEVDVQTWVKSVFKKNNDDLSLIRFFTHAIMHAYQPLPINKDKQFCIDSDLILKKNLNLLEHEKLTPKFLMPLPREILKSVFSYYLANDPHWNAVEDFAMTCIQFYNLATEPASFSELLRYGCVNQLGMSKSFVLSKFPFLEKISNVSLDFTDSERINEKDLPSLFACAGYHSFKFKESSLEKIFINARVLRNLTAHSPNLVHLSLLGAEKLTNESIFSLASRCTDLSSLKLSHCRNITPEALIALTACTKLHSIELDFLKNENRLALNLKEGETYLNPFDQWSSFLTKHQDELFKLQLSNLFFSRSGFEGLVTKFASTLNKIALTSALECNKNALSSFKVCTNLRHFKFLDTEVVIDDTMLENITKEWGELKSCTILYSPKLSSKGIQSLLQHCRKLERLTLDNYKIDAQTVQNICSNAVSLKELHFPSSCRMVSDFNITGLIELLAKNAAMLSNLKLFEFSIEGEEIPAALLKKLAASFPSLEFVMHSERFPSESSLESIEESFPDFCLNSYL